MFIKQQPLNKIRYKPSVVLIKQYRYTDLDIHNKLCHNIKMAEKALYFDPDLYLDNTLKKFIEFVKAFDL